MRALILVLVLGVAALAGCATQDTCACSPPPPLAPIVIDAGDPRLPEGTPALRVGDLAFFPIFNATAVPMTDIPGHSHRETSLAVAPNDPSLLFACDPSGVPNFAPPLGDGHSYFYLSVDNGTTWTETDIEAGMTDLRRATFEGGDCDVAIDAAGTLYSADTWLGNLAVGSSRDKGITWSTTNPAAGTAPVIDRPWLLGGKAGEVFLTYQDVQFGMPSLIWFTKSTDYGQTFLPAVPVTTATPDGPYTWTGNFAVANEGQDLYSVYTRQAGPSHDIGGKPESVWVAASHDAGLTWTSHLVSNRPDTASYLYPSIALDGGGILHVVFSQRGDEGQGHPIWYAASADGAATWSEPVPLRNATVGYSPWIAGGKGAGQALAIWDGSLDPDAGFGSDNDWYLFWARIDNGTIQSGTTTAEPLFTGERANLGFAEFDMVRLDRDGRAHIGASFPFEDGDGVRWQAMYQRQDAGAFT